MTLAELLPLLDGVKRSGDGYTAPCLVHEDKHQSLSASEPNGELLVYCHAGCTFEQIMAEANRRAGPAATSARTIEAAWRLLPPSWWANA